MRSTEVYNILHTLARTSMLTSQEQSPIPSPCLQNKVWNSWGRERGEEEERQTYPSCGTFPLVSGEKDESWNLSRRPWQACTDGLLDNLERDVEGVIRGEEAQQEEPGGRGNLLLHSLPLKRQTLGGWKSTMWSLPDLSNASWRLLLAQSEFEARSSRLNFASMLVFCHTSNNGSELWCRQGSAEACREWRQQGSLHVLVK